MTHVLKTFITTLAALAFVVLSPQSHLGAASTMTSSMGTMSHSSAPVGCSLLCVNSLSRYNDELTQPESDEDDDFPMAPFYVSLMPEVVTPRSVDIPSKFTNKPPPKIPLYIAFAQLRP